MSNLCAPVEYHRACARLVLLLDIARKQSNFDRDPIEIWLRSDRNPTIIRLEPDCNPIETQSWSSRNSIIIRSKFDRSLIGVKVRSDRDQILIELRSNGGRSHHHNCNHHHTGFRAQFHSPTSRIGGDARHWQIELRWILIIIWSKFNHNPIMLMFLRFKHWVIILSIVDIERIDYR